MSSLAPPTSPRPGLAGNGAGSTATFMPGDDVLNPGLAGIVNKGKKKIKIIKRHLCIRLVTVHATTTNL